jgi:AcrR family transcriptional regulator
MTREKADKPYHHGELREALVAAGRALLEEKGLRGFTLRECARRASVSHAAPAHHFASIDDLLAEIATRGYRELAEAMTAEAGRSRGDAAARLVGQSVGYMAFAAANPMLFRLMFNRETEDFATPDLVAAAKENREVQAAAIAAALPRASTAVKTQMADFAWATVHGFITLVLERQIGDGEPARLVKARSLAVLSAMADAVVGAGGK